MWFICLFINSISTIEIVYKIIIEHDFLMNRFFYNRIAVLLSKNNVGGVNLTLL